MRKLTRRIVNGRKRVSKYGKKSNRPIANFTISKYDLIDKISSFRIKNKFDEVNELETILYDVIQQDKLEDIHTYEIELDYRIAKKYFRNLL